jgi:circadian clock protein KaiB
MNSQKKSSPTQTLEETLATQPPVKCLLRLYVAGATARSQQAILRARELCETEFDGNCELEVIDIYQQPILARDGQIVATPTLVKELPRPVRRLIGDLSNTSRILAGLDLPDQTKPPR